MASSLDRRVASGERSGDFLIRPFAKVQLIALGFDELRFYVALSGLKMCWVHVPRAMPWVVLFRPFRALEGQGLNSYCVRLNNRSDFYLAGRAIMGPAFLPKERFPGRHKLCYYKE